MSKFITGPATAVERLTRGVISGVVGAPSLLKQFMGFVPFFFLILMVLVSEPIRMLGRFRLCKSLTAKFGPSLTTLHDRLVAPLNRHPAGTLAPSDVVLLAMSHLRVKRIRSMITIGGMAIGFGAVIYLLSLGYGFQRLVVSRVATLGEMKQIDVTTGQATSLVFNSEIIDKLLGIEPVDTVLPVISTVSKVTYNNSVSDVVVYGVTTRFLEESAVQPIRGEIFADEQYVSDAAEGDQMSQSGSVGGTVAGATVDVVPNASLGEELYEVQYAIFPQVWKPVHQSPSTDSKVIGYTKRTTGQRSAREVWGGPYGQDAVSLVGTDGEGNAYQTWVADTVHLWKRQSCATSDYDCVDGEYVALQGASGQLRSSGYLTEEDLSVTRYGGVNTGLASLRDGAVVQDTDFSFGTSEAVAVYTAPAAAARSTELFTKTEATNTELEGQLVVGEYYYDEASWGYLGTNRNGKKLGYWVQAELPLWRKLDCGEDCEYYLSELNETQEQVTQVVYFRAGDVALKDLDVPPKTDFTTAPGLVLGLSTDDATASAAFTASGSAMAASASAQLSSEELSAMGITGVEGLSDLDWAMIASQAGIVAETQSSDTLPLPEGARKIALVNTAMLTLLGIAPADALGMEFSTTFLLDGGMFGRQNYNAESEPATYKIIGILPDDRTPAFYVPLGDIKGLGVKNYSQLKVIADDTANVPSIRTEAESLGFRTSSVVDTIENINSLFAYLRLGLLVLGLIALGVAALGMFNTLTVSLLEKTREVGLMKAMGMKSKEVQQLFLAESIIMGMAGGFFGLLFGYAAGKITSLVLTSISLASGSGGLNITYIPIGLTMSILGFSFVVGILTGWYPARRATKVSALNALRYE